MGSGVAEFVRETDEDCMSLMALIWQRDNRDTKARGPEMALSCLGWSLKTSHYTAGAYRKSCESQSCEWSLQISRHPDCAYCSACE